MRRRQRLAGEERLRIEHQHAGLHIQNALPWRLAQLLQQLHRMAQPRRLNEQSIRPCLAQQTTETNLKRRAIDATQTAPGHFAQCDTIGVTGQQRGIEADLAELVDQYRPALTRWTLRQQVPDQAGLAGPQWPGDDVGGYVLQHDRRCLGR
ncbi:hypothetical protein D3C86_1486430 [compost metagenome]